MMRTTVLVQRLTLTEQKDVQRGCAAAATVIGALIYGEPQ